MVSDGTVGLRIYPDPMVAAMVGLALARDRLCRKLEASGVSEEQSERMNPLKWERIVERIAGEEFRAFQEAVIRVGDLEVGRAS
jgi:hypothetical protein